MRISDFIARYGGDEFCIITDIADPDTLETTVKRIGERVDAFNRFSKKPYKLNFSMGYAIYDCKSGMSAEEFKKKIDAFMYEDKNSKRCESLDGCHRC